jgi:hypothetical protein
MQRSYSVRFPPLAAVLTALAFVAGCGGKTATGVGDSNVVSGNGRSEGGGVSDPDDPFGACVLTSASGGRWPLVCSNGRPCTGNSQGACSPQGCEQVAHVTCDNDCNVDSDCPIPSTGSSRPQCRSDYHFCRLPCSVDTDCPSGSTCQDGTQWLARDSNGESLGLPHMCMQTMSFVAGQDGGL